MREINEVHEAERDREAAGDHEQQHAVGDAVEEDGEHTRVSNNRLTLRDAILRIAPQGEAYSLEQKPHGEERTSSAPRTMRLEGKPAYFFAAFTGSLTSGKLANSTL